MTEMAVVGLGAWGLCVLERAVARAAVTGRPVRLHLVEPSLGGGVYSTAQPDYLVLNNACGQLSLYAAPDHREPLHGLGLHEWAIREGYRWNGWSCVRSGPGRPIEPTDYLPRRLMGEYLAWFYATLLQSAPPNLEILRHHTSATDIVSDRNGREVLHLADGTTLTVDHVVLTSGHTWNDEPSPTPGGLRPLRPYPVDFLEGAVAPGAPVAIAGMGLVAYDLMAAMTIGRGGRFEAEGDRLRYERTGREPTIYLYSRSGVPYCAKSAHGIDPYGAYVPLICTPEAFADLSQADGHSVRRQVDFRADLLPLLMAEMTARYHGHAAARSVGPEGAELVRQRLATAWAEGRWDAQVASLGAVHGAFDPMVHLFAGSGMHDESGADYQARFTAMVRDDLREALTVGGSPVKAAQEVMRILRDQLRSVIEFGGLSLESYIDFQANVRGRINRLEAGPPPMRSQQLLALLDAGVVRVPFGPSPEVTALDDRRIAIRSTQLDQMSTATVGSVIRGHLDLPSLARSASPLLKRLYAKGRLTQLSYGATPVGSVAINDAFHPYDLEGRVQPHVSLLGVLTEGVRYFTHYLPSPQSRLRAVLDAQLCVEDAIG